MLGRIREEVRTVADASLVVRSVAWAVVLPFLKHVVHVRSLAAIMHRTPVVDARDTAREHRIIVFARWAARLTRWTSGGNCLERGLIAYRFLCAAAAHPTLVVGIGRGDAGVIGHAWVLVDGELVGEPLSAIEAYTPVFAFGPDGRLVVQSIGAPRRVPASQT